MGVARYFSVKAINLSIVLITVLLITAVLFGATGLSDKILKAIINEEVRAYRAQIASQHTKLSEEEINTMIEKFKKNLEIQYGLNKPWYVRLPDMIKRIVTLDLGTSRHMTSFSGSNQIRDIILERLPYTVLLVTTATVIVFIIGLGFGTWLSTKVGSLWDRSISLYSAISYATPTWWLGLFLILVFSYYLRLLPFGGLLSPNPPKELLPRLLDMTYHAILPVTTLTFALSGSAIYIYRSILVSTANEDFVAVARAKGLPENIVLRRYIVRPSLHPILTNLVLGLAASFTGAILTETVFNWPGMGRLYYEAILSVDEPLILALTYVFTLIYVAARFILEVLYVVVDPRVSVE